LAPFQGGKRREKKFIEMLNGDESACDVRCSQEITLCVKMWEKLGRKICLSFVKKFTE
jgi:hypothetical protein